MYWNPSGEGDLMKRAKLVGPLGNLEQVSGGDWQSAGSGLMSFQKQRRLPTRPGVLGGNGLGLMEPPLQSPGWETEGVGSMAKCLHWRTGHLADGGMYNRPGGHPSGSVSSWWASWMSCSTSHLAALTTQAEGKTVSVVAFSSLGANCREIALGLMFRGPGQKVRVMLNLPTNRDHQGGSSASRLNGGMTGFCDQSR